VQLTEKSRVTSSDFGGDPQRPATWIDQSGEVLRELPNRRVYRAVAGGHRVVVKEYRPQRLRHYLRAYAETEAERALAAARAGVPVVEPLAWARMGDGREFLILREETGARTLKELVLQGALKGAERHELARAVGTLFARLQNAGFRHDDPHAGNVLVRPDGSVLLADAHDLRPGDYLTTRARAADLARFGTFFLTHGTMVDVLLFWGAYGRTSGLFPEDIEALRAEVLDRLPGAFRRLAGSRARRARRHGRSVKIGAFSGKVLADIAPSVLEQIVEHATHLRRGPHVIKASRTGWTLSIDEFVVKVFLPKKATRALRDFIQGTRAQRALDAAEALIHRGLRTPEVMAVLQDGIVPTRSILVMRRIRDALPLEDVARTLSPAELRAAAMRIGRTLRRMHDWGLRHRDLKQQNLLLSANGRTICFLDLDGVRQTLCGPLDWDRRAKDLANLSSSLLDFNLVPTGLRLRMLDAYMNGDVPPGFEPGAFPRRVAEIAERMRERRAQR